MSTYIPSPAFQDAAAYLSSAASLSRVSSTIKLELYGLFKYLTVSHTPNASRPSLFDMTGKAKWDAWNATSKTYDDRSADAEKRYLDIAHDLGWENGSNPAPVPVKESSPEEIESIDDIWDDESSGSSTSESNPSGGGGGMGTSVSAMAPPTADENDAGTLHGLAIANNAEGMSSYIDAHPDVDINELDEHGYTPLHLACDRGNITMVKLLLKNGADGSLKDPDDFTAMELAIAAEHDEIASLLQSF